MTSPTVAEFDWSIRTQGRLVPAWRTNYRALADTSSPSTSEDTSQTVSYIQDGGPGAGNVISDGRYTLPSGNGAGGGEGRCYRVVAAGAPVTRVGGRFTLDGTAATTNDCSLIAFIYNESVTNPDSPPSGATIGLHVVIYNDHWEIDKLTAPSGSWVNTQLAVGYHQKPLVADGVHEYEVDAYVVGDTAYVRLPDGTVETITDSDIGSWCGDWAAHEVDLSNSTDALFGWAETWTDTATYTDLPSPAPADEFAPVELGYVQVAESFVPPTQFVPSAAAEIPGLSINLPAVGARPVWIELNANSVFCVDTGNPDTTFAIASSATNAVAAQIVQPVASAGQNYVSTPVVRVRVAPGTPATTFNAQAYTSAATTTYTTTGSGDTTFNDIATSHPSVYGLTGAQVATLNPGVTQPIAASTVITLPLVIINPFVFMYMTATLV